MTTIDILMPALSPTMTAGNLVRWLKGEGDPIKSGDVIAEIETDKSIVELEAVDAGRLGQILVADGTQDVPVNQRIATLIKTGSEAAAKSSAFPQSASAPSQDASSAEASTSVLPSSSPPVPQTTGAEIPLQRIFSSPLARRIAREKGIDLTQVQGSGARGRIVRADVEGAQQGASGSRYTEVPVSHVRKTIARRLMEAKATIPHFYQTIDCNVDALLKSRADLNARADAHKLSLNDFIIRAVALALRKVPTVNASWHEQVIRMYDAVHVAVAVATPNGLITPVVRNADHKGVATISKEMKALTRRAREGRLSLGEYEGGGFTVSNLGMYGIREFAAIINPPQACILALGAAEKRVIVTREAPAIATMMTCTLSADHRVVDGVAGAEFLSAFRNLIEDPTAILMDLD